MNWLQYMDCVHCFQQLLLKLSLI